MAKKIKEEEIHDEDWYDNENYIHECEANDEFMDSEIGKLFVEKADEWLGCIVNARENLLDRVPPSGFYVYKSNEDDLRKLLSADTDIEYDAWEYDEKDGWTEITEWSESECSDNQSALCHAVYEYLVAALALAREYASLSVDLWAEALDTITYVGCNGPFFNHSSFTETMADRVLDLIHKASKRLRMDMMIKDMPNLKTLIAKEKKKENASSGKKKSKGKKR